jgi:CHAT domain
VSNYIQEAFDCYKLLKSPQKSASKNLIIVPDGLLSFFPFEALIAKKTKTTNFAKMPYLLTYFVVGYSNSANFYLNSNSLNNKSESVLGVFPIY